MKVWITISIFIVAVVYTITTKHPALADPPPTTPAVCVQPPLTVSNNYLVASNTPAYTYSLYLPLIFKPSPSPPCTVYCGLALENDSYRPAGYSAYFADEFDCHQLLDYWAVQPQMTAASYTPPATGYIDANNGSLKIGVPGTDTSFPYLYLVDNSATGYDVPHTLRRVDWLPDTGDFRIAMRLRFNIDKLGEHRIAIYADGHRPNYAGPLFYIGTDYNAEQEAWRGLIVGADRGQNFVDLGDYGFPDPYTDWVVLTVDFNYSADTFILSINGTPVIIKPLSSFKGYPQAAIRPDVLYLGSLAQLEEPTHWTDIELDWLRVYAPQFTPEAAFGLLTTIEETPPTPTDAPTLYSTSLPPGPFTNTPHWSEDFTNLAQMPDNWHLVHYSDPYNSWTTVENSYAKVLNNGQAGGVPVWAIFDDMLPMSILSRQQETERESPADYLRRRGGWSLLPDPNNLTATAVYTRTNWRPDSGNIRYAWRGFQSANGYGVEISNGGHGDWGDTVYFTGAMFYTLMDTTSPGGGQFIFPGCQEQYFWRLHLLPEYKVKDSWTTINADYINGTVHLYVDGRKIGWWPESDCSLNWYLKGENVTSPEVLFFGNPATAYNAPGSWSEVYVDWFATFPGLPRNPPM